MKFTKVWKAEIRKPVNYTGEDFRNIFNKVRYHAIRFANLYLSLKCANAFGITEKIKYKDVHEIYKKIIQTKATLEFLYSGCY